MAEDKESNSKIDYVRVGLKAGLEIHQQLNTHKLFCECPSLLRSDAPTKVVERFLNPVVGETGKIDIAAEFEKAKGQRFMYEVFDTNCLVELDEEPPHEMNPEALKITMQIALLLNCKIFPVTQIMRKTVVDGSNTSGFQRTVLIAYDGFVETSFGRVGIETLMLEEDAARPASGGEDIDSDGGNVSVKRYKLDRLGIPLIEIATKPELKNPEMIKECALKIGEILRACNVRRGIGTIRQDLNISVKGSERVEIKGFQDPRMMIRTVDLEIQRQLMCVREKKCQKEVRKANADGTTSFLRPLPGSARMYPETDLELLKISRDMLNDAKANLPKLLSENKSYLKQFGLNDELIKLILDENKLDEFKVLAGVVNNPSLIAKMLVVYLKDIAVHEKKTIEEIQKKLSMEVLENILKETMKNTISESDVKMVMQKLAEGKTLKEAVVKEKIDLAGEIDKLIKEKPGLGANAYMGLMMAKLKGKVSGKEVMDEISKKVK
jgi:Glu-tRNA(Gln) amidotransferase subunit E-like FAD-binding protein